MPAKIYRLAGKFDFGNSWKFVFFCWQNGLFPDFWLDRLAQCNRMESTLNFWLAKMHRKLYLGTDSKSNTSYLEKQSAVASITIQSCKIKNRIFSLESHLIYIYICLCGSRKSVEPAQYADNHFGLIWMWSGLCHYLMSDPISDSSWILDVT